MTPGSILALVVVITSAAGAPQLPILNSRVSTDPASQGTIYPSSEPTGLVSGSAFSFLRLGNAARRASSAEYGWFPWLWPARNGGLNALTSSPPSLPTSSPTRAQDQQAGPTDHEHEPGSRLETAAVLAVKPRAADLDETDVETLTVTVTVTASKRSGEDSSSGSGWSDWFPWALPPHALVVDETTETVTTTTAAAARLERMGQDLDVIVSVTVSVTVTVTTAAQTFVSSSGESTSLPTLSDPLLSWPSSTSTELPLPPSILTSGPAWPPSSAAVPVAPDPATTPISSTGGLPAPIPWDSSISDTLTMWVPPHGTTLVEPSSTSSASSWAPITTMTFLTSTIAASGPDTTPAPSTSSSSMCDDEFCSMDGTSYCMYWGGMTSNGPDGPFPGETIKPLGSCTYSDVESETTATSTTVEKAIRTTGARQVPRRVQVF